MRTFLKKLNKEQKADLQMVKDLVQYLYETGAIKTNPTTKEIEKTFLGRLNENLEKRV